MSYILDALRRADAERERGAVPGIHAQPVPAVSSDGRAPRHGLPVAWLAAGTAVAVVGVLAWQLGQRSAAPAPPAPAAPPPAMPMAQAPAQAPVQPAAQPVPQPAAQPPARRAAAPPAAPPAVRTPPPAPAPARATARAPAAEPAPRAQPAQRTAARADAPSPARAPATPARPVDKRVFALHELPDDVRNRLPKLSIGGSRYSPDPAKRFLIVNGLLLKEKDAVTPEVTLEEIQLRAAVLRYQDYRYGITY